MGNKLSQIHAEIFVGVGLNKALLEMNNIVTFFVIYINDMLALCHKGYVDIHRKTIMNHCGGMELKLDQENQFNEVQFLNMAISNVSHRILMRWWQKPQSTQRILDYNSFHPKIMKENIIKEFLKNALLITSPCHWDFTTNLVQRVFSNSDYPKRLIRKTIRNVRINFGSISFDSVGQIDGNAQGIISENIDKMFYVKECKKMKPLCTFSSCN